MIQLQISLEIDVLQGSEKIALEPYGDIRRVAIFEADAVKHNF